MLQGQLMITYRRRDLVLGAAACLAEALLSRGAVGKVPQVGAAALADEPGVAAGPRSEPTSWSTGGVSAVAADRSALWDGNSGIDSLYFNAGALLPWENKGGDWTDAAGVAQGSVSYATLISGAPGAFAADISVLVRQWYRLGNTGAYLKASGSATVGSRIHPDAGKRPVLLLTDATGTIIEILCSASAGISADTANGIRTGAIAVGANQNIALQFELPRPAAPFVSARLQLISIGNDSRPLVLKVFALRPPKLFSGGTPVAGVAAKYPGDIGIETDADVYFGGFDSSNFPEGSVTLDRSAAPDAAFPEALNARYNPESFAACTTNHRWSTKRGNLPTRNAKNGLLVRQELPSAQFLAKANSDCPTELYFRYYLKLKSGYHCSVDGKKLPGLAGRYGVWTGDDQVGDYEPQTGNGGSPTTGDFDGTSLNGWSVRHHAFVAPGDANPLRGLIPLNYYAYFVGMGDRYGSFWRWGNHALGYVNVEEDTWFCLEHYVKVNAVNGPFDPNGNGAAVADGIVRGWLDGVLVFEKTDAVLRVHPAIRIDEVWLDHYHGGPRPAETTHRVSMAALVVARKYIGPQSRPAARSARASNAAC
jgi:hypothetical protein